MPKGKGNAWKSTKKQLLNRSRAAWLDAYPSMIMKRAIPIIRH